MKTRIEEVASFPWDRLFVVYDVGNEDGIPALDFYDENGSISTRLIGADVLAKLFVNIPHTIEYDDDLQETLYPIDGYNGFYSYTVESNVSEQYYLYMLTPTAVVKIVEIVNDYCRVAL